MSDVRIVLTRNGQLWFWEFTAQGAQHVARQGSETAEGAAEAAESFRRQLDLAAHFRKMKAARAKQAG
jgi:hypothetical protein